jgi:CheY-like chemotaxis protein
MGKTLLLADDSVTIQKVVGISFASEDISLVTVDNGDDAIARARALRPDVILADVVMPGKSGYEVCEAINADPALRHIPVLLLTGTFEAFDAERAQRAGAAGHISKPFEAQALVERVKRLLANAPAPAAAPPARPAAAGAPRAAGTGAAAPPRAPAPPARDDAFDFLDEAPPAPPARTATAASKLAEPEPTDAGLEFDGGDSAFAFGDDDFASSSSSASPASATAHTVAILPDAPPPAPDDDFALGGDAELELAPRGARAESVAARSVEETDFDYEFEGVGATDAGADVAPQATVLDPIAGSEYDVSSSDLATTLPPVEAPDATRLLEPTRAPQARLGEDPVMDLLEGDLDEAAPLDVDPADETFDRMPASLRGAPAQAAKTVVQMVSTPDSGEVSSDLDASWGAAPPVRPPAQTQPPRPPAPRASAPRPAAGAPIADAALERIAPALRAQLHETLEKIAWEAFGRVAETIIEQAVERLEKAAWEVVPRLAETLIQEEIRRLKEESEEA